MGQEFQRLVDVTELIRSPENQIGSLSEMEIIPQMITTVITSYNKGRFLAEAIESAIIQDYSPHEILVIDDGSTDDTYEIASSYGSRVRLVSQPNLGQCSAKNRGIKEARGEFIAFLDGDDIWRKGKLRKQIELFAGNSRLGVVYTDRLKFRGDKVVWPTNRVAHEFHRGIVLDELLVDNFVPFSSALCRKNALVKVGMLDEDVPIAPDYDLWLRMALNFEFDFVDEVLLEYRLASGSIGDQVKCKVEHTLRIQNRFIERHFEGVYPNQDAVRKATSRKYTAMGNNRLSEFRNVAALKAYLIALKNDPLNSDNYICVVRAMIPARIANRIKKWLPRFFRTRTL